MKVGWRDAGATLLVAAVVVPFIGYAARGSMPFIQDSRGMAATGFVGALLAFAAVGRSAFSGRRLGETAAILAVLTTAAGVTAFVLEGSWVVVAPFIAGIVVLWAIAMLHDGGYLTTRAQVARQ